MAKISARGAYKLAGVRLDMPNDGDWRSRYRYVLRSDGKVLVQYQCAIHYDGQRDYFGGGGYSVHGKVKDRATFDLVAWATKRHPTATAVVVDR